MSHRPALVVALLLLAGCQKPPANPWPGDVVENFLHACRGQTSDAQCRCALYELQNRFTVEEFRAFERELAAGTVPKPLGDAIAGCAGR